MTHEIRSGLPLEFRADDAGQISVSGYAAVFDQPAAIGGYFREQISKGAFADAIGRDDVVFLVNHSGLPLARTKSGTLTLKEDARGLFMSAKLDETDPDVMAIVPKMKRGDMDKMSFAFRAEVEEWDETGEMPTRTLKKVALRDVSIVNYPAYEGTDIGLRSLEAFRTEQKRTGNTPARMRMKLALSGLVAK